MHSSVNSAKKAVSGSWSKLTSMNWRNPRILVTAGAVMLLPFVGSYYVNIGLFTGATMAAAALWLIDKCPSWVKRWCKQYPLAADFIASSIVVLMIGKLFTAGLTLAISAMVTAVILSVAIPFLVVDEEPDREYSWKAA